MNKNDPSTLSTLPARAKFTTANVPSNGISSSHGQWSRPLVDQFLSQPSPSRQLTIDRIPPTAASLDSQSFPENVKDLTKDSTKDSS
jgi:hypothetical protein